MNISSLLRYAADWLDRRQHDEVVEVDAVPGLDPEGEELIAQAVPTPEPLAPALPLRGSLASRLRGLG